MRRGAWNADEHHGWNFHQWMGSHTQRDAMGRVHELSARYHGMGRAAAARGGGDELTRVLGRAQWHLLRAETSCNFYWGEAWVYKAHDDLNSVAWHLGEAQALVDRLTAPAAHEADAVHGVSHPGVLLLIAVVGAGLAVQAATNARMGPALGVPVASALLNFLIGSVLLTLALASGLFGRARLAGLAEAPWWAYIGGALGAPSSPWRSSPFPGSAPPSPSPLSSPASSSARMVIDTFGWLEVTPVPLNPWRLVGAVVLLAGVVLIQQK